MKKITPFELYLFLFLLIIILLFSSCSTPIQKEKCELIANTMHLISLTLCEFITTQATLKNSSNKEIDSLTTYFLLEQLYTSRYFLSQHYNHYPFSYPATPEQFSIFVCIQKLDSLILILKNSHSYQ